MKQRKNGKTARGFTLIEAALTILVIGVALAGAAALYDQARRQSVPLETRQKMDMIVHALSNYVEIQNRLPCPADPAVTDVTFGWEWHVTPAMAYASSGSMPSGYCDGTTRAGIVPFQALGLPPEAALDGRGRYFTYAVSPEFTLDNDANLPNFTPGLAPSDLADRVHARCRDGAWIESEDNLSTPKARFCCAVSPASGTYYQPATDIRIRLHTDASGDISPVRDDNSTAYETLETKNTDPASGRVAVSTGNIIAPAFVLVSHGDDGRGAFLANGTANRLDADPAYVAESENWDADNLFFTGLRNAGQAAAGYFDDVVIWMTQDGIMAANGTSSCQYP